MYNTHITVRTSTSHKCTDFTQQMNSSIRCKNTAISKLAYWFTLIFVEVCGALFNNANLLNVLTGFGTDKSANVEFRPWTLGERKNGSKIYIFVNTEDFGLRSEEVCSTVRVLEGHFETVVTRKDITTVEIHPSIWDMVYGQSLPYKQA